MKVIGLDLSLASTGFAVYYNGAIAVDRIRVPARPNDHAQFRRIRLIASGVQDLVRGHGGTGDADLVVVEGLAVASQTGQHLTRAGMWHLVMEAIDARGIPWAQVPPTTLKKYATGKGNAGKDEVLAAVIRRFSDIEVRGNDEADALVLAAMGADWLGEPMADMPAANRASLAKVAWPELRHSAGHILPAVFPR